MTKYIVEVRAMNENFESEMKGGFTIDDFLIHSCKHAHGFDYAATFIGEEVLDILRVMRDS